MQSLLPKDDEPIRPIQPPQPQQPPQAAPPQGYAYPPQNYPPQNYPPPNYPPQGYAPQPQPVPVQLMRNRRLSVRVEFEDFDSHGRRRGIDRRLRVFVLPVK